MDKYRLGKEILDWLQFCLIFEVLINPFIGGTKLHPMIKYYLTFYWRSIKNNKALSLINALALAKRTKKLRAK